MSNMKSNSSYDSSSPLLKWLQKSKNSTPSITNDKKNAETKGRNEDETEAAQSTTAASEVFKKTNDSIPKKNVKFNPCFLFFHSNKTHMIRCKYCFEFPEIVKLHSQNRKVPAIASESGTKYIEQIALTHLDSIMHKECQKAYQQSKLNATEVMKVTPIGQFIQQANLALANHIGKLFIHTYGSAKKSSFSGNNFPARVAIARAAENFDINNYPITDCEDNLQYVSPSSYRELLQIIVECHRPEWELLLSSCLAISLRCDGSVDRTQIDKIYTMAKAITTSGKEVLYFLGAEEPQERGAKGLLEAVKNGCEKTLGSNCLNNLMTKISSLVTDGASVNRGEEAGLWKLFEDYLRTIATDDSMFLTLLKIWCSAHRSDLAWKSVTKTVKEVKNIINESSSMASFFHKSGMRTNELKSPAKENKTVLVSLPTRFEIRWTENTCDLLDAVLTSWYTLVIYFKNSKEPEAAGFYKFLTDKSNLELLSFLADTLQVFSRFQQNLQKDDTTLLGMMQYVHSVCTKLKSLETKPLLGGWEETLKKQISESMETFQLHGITLTAKNRRSKAHNLYVSERRDPSAIKNEVILSLINFTEDRFKEDENIVNILKRFINFDDTLDLKEVHNCIATDLDISALDLEYSEILQMPMLASLKGKPLIETIQKLISLESYPLITTIFARIAAAKPHSADVERLISCSNKIKTADRAQLTVETENLYLYISFNMPPLDSWDPRPAIRRWLETKDRRQKSHPKAKEQIWFNGIYKEAAKKRSRSRDDDKEKEKPPKKRCF